MSEKNIKITNIDTKILDNMYRNNKIVESIDMSELDGSEIISMKNMFAGCENLKSITLPKNMGAIKDISYAFYDCKSLRNIDLRGIKIDNVMITDMFHNNNSLETVYVNNVSEAFKIHDMVSKRVNIEVNNVKFSDLRVLQSEIEFMKVQIEYLMKRLC
jgi:hypothetical protein